MKKDLNEIARIEKAIKEKYGEEAIQNPKGLWTEEKEKKYLSDLKIFYNGKEKKRKSLEPSPDRTCPVCGTYSFSVKDDLYMNKFECCFECYIQYVEDREERWKTGWRPNK
tara:strand:+ start:6993 stop:7325 length:333 start_codon:yes stop_codon:yes gene_type:complete